MPLISRKQLGKPITRLDPVVMIRRIEYVMLVQDLAAVSANVLGPVIISMAEKRSEIVAALDLLFTGS